MADTRQLLGALTIGAVLGGGGYAIVDDKYETSAVISEIRPLYDDADDVADKIAVSFKTKIGDCGGDRQLVYLIDGTHPLLNGRAVEGSGYDAIGTSAAAFVAQTAKLQVATGGRVIEAHLLTDGQMEVSVAREVTGVREEMKIIYDADGSHPRVGNVPIDTKETNDVGTALVSMKGSVTDHISALKSTLTKPLDQIIPVVVSESAPLVQPTVQ